MTGYLLEIRSNGARVHYSEHDTREQSTETLVALGFPLHTHILVFEDVTGDYFSLYGHDSFSVRVARLNRRARKSTVVLSKLSAADVHAR